jgi:hypothetical protein
MKWLLIMLVVLLVGGSAYAIAKNLSLTAETTFPIDI